MLSRYKNSKLCLFVKTSAKCFVLLPLPLITEPLDVWGAQPLVAYNIAGVGTIFQIFIEHTLQ